MYNRLQRPPKASQMEQDLRVASNSHHRSKQDWEKKEKNVNEKIKNTN